MTARRRRSERSGRRLLVVAAAAAVAALTPAGFAGCGLGDRAARAERLIDSVDLLAEAGTAVGSVVVTLTLLEAPPAAEGAVRGGSFAGQPSDVIVDVAGRRAALGPADAPTHLFDGLVAYGRRLDAAEGDARPWMKVDLEEVTEGSVSAERLAPEAIRNALNPSFLVDLIAGALSGSVEEVGSKDLRGERTTRYDANFDVDKTLHDTRRRRYPEREREALDDVLKLLDVSGRVFPGSVWLDAQGRPRRFQVGLRVSPQPGFVLELRLDLELHSVGGAVMPGRPTDLELLETDSLGAYLFAVTPMLAGR